MLHYKESLVEESFHASFHAPSTEHRGISKSELDNIINTLKSVLQSVHSFWNSIYYNNTTPDLCCSRDVLEEEEF